MIVFGEKKCYVARGLYEILNNTLFKVRQDGFVPKMESNIVWISV